MSANPLACTSVQQKLEDFVELASISTMPVEDITKQGI